MEHTSFLLLFFLFLIVNGQSTTPNPTSEKETKEENSKTTASAATGAASSVQYVAAKSEEVKGKPNNNITSSEEELAYVKDMMEGHPDDSSSDSTSDENEDELLMDSSEDPLFPSNTDEVESRVSPTFERENEPELEESPENSEPTDDQNFRNEPNGDGSLELELSQGGYERPYQMPPLRNQRRRLRLEGATEQEQRVETPESNLGERSRIPFQNPFAPFLQAPFNLASAPVFRHPFEQQGLPNTDRAIQNSFYNTQPELSQQYSRLENAGDYPNVHFTIQTAPRVPQHHPFLFQTPFQIRHPVDPVRQMPSLFQARGSPGYPNYGGDSVAPNFASLFGNPMSQSLPPQQPYGVNPNSGGNVFANQPLNLMSTFANTDGRSQFAPRLLSQPLPNGPIQGRNAEIAPDSPPKEIEEEQRNEPPVQEEPFGARIQKQPDEESQGDVERQDNEYIRYPIKEAGYATKEPLPAENETKSTDKEPIRQGVPFFAIPPRFNMFNGPDPYKIALENVQRDYPKMRNNEDKNDTKEPQSEELIRNLAIGPNQLQEPSQIFRAYPERNQGLSIPSTPFFPLQSSDRNPFEPVGIFPNNRYQYIARPPLAQETKVTPACAKNTNSSLCFEDQEYPRGEIMYGLNSDSYIMDRLVMPTQQLDGIPLVELNKTENVDSEDNYICKSDIKYGLPLRGRNVEGEWKVIVNVGRAMGRGRFVQPVRLEVCKSVGEACSSTLPKTACVQKYSLQRLLSWSVEKGMHNDVYRLPVACSCQILDEKEE